jgi:hypothetical protein
MHHNCFCEQYYSAGIDICYIRLVTAVLNRVPILGPYRLIGAIKAPNKYIRNLNITALLKLHFFEQE